MRSINSFAKLASLLIDEMKNEKVWKSPNEWTPQHEFKFYDFNLTSLRAIFE